MNYSPSGKVKANKALKYTLFITQLFTNTRAFLGNIYLIISLGKVYYDPKHPAGFGSVAKLVNASKNKKKHVELWLSIQNTYTLHKPVRKKFPRNPYTVTNIDDVWEMDLSDLGSLTKYKVKYNTS